MNESSCFLPAGNKEGLQKNPPDVHWHVAMLYRAEKWCTGNMCMIQASYISPSTGFKKNFPPRRSKKFRGSPFSSHCSHALRRAGPGGVYVSLRL